jgi:hypothetical protein
MSMSSQRILPTSVYVLTPQEERDYDRGGYDRETVEASLTRRFGELRGQPVEGFTEAQRRDGRVIGRYIGRSTGKG